VIVRAMSRLRSLARRVIVVPFARSSLMRRRRADGEFGVALAGESDLLVGEHGKACAATRSPFSVAAYTSLTAQTASEECVYLRSKHADLQKPVENRSERGYERLSPQRACLVVSDRLIRLAAAV